MTATASDLQALERLIGSLPKDKLGALLEMQAIRDRLGKWTPNPGPQTDAFHCEADELFYGGQAGGGKTDLVVGLSLVGHARSLVLRRTNKEASKLVERYIEVIGDREGWNGQQQTWHRPDGKVIDIGGCQHEDDKQKYKGSPHDLIAFDEITDFTETQYRFITGWNRSTDKKQRCRVVATGNPPTTPEGLWVLKYWGTWLDPTHPRPAKPGELRWFTTINGEDTEVDGPGPHWIGGEEIMARSRTFIPAALSDNPDLSETNYASVLAALPEELRPAYKEGRFDASLKDDAFQVIPTKWIVAAQERWKPEGYRDTTMTAMAFDPAGGGSDAEELIWRHGGWFAEPVTAKGAETSDGSRAAGKIVQYRQHNAPVVVDVGGGYGGSVTLRMRDNGITPHPFNGAAASHRTTKDGKLKFVNKRSEAIWRLREELDPDQEGGSAIALPPSPEIRADLAAPRWELSARGIQVESKEEIRKRIGRSPGKGDVIVMCLSEGQEVITRQLFKASRKEPRVIHGYAKAKGYTR